MMPVSVFAFAPSKITFPILFVSIFATALKATPFTLKLFVALPIYCASSSFIVTVTAAFPTFPFQS